MISNQVVRELLAPFDVPISDESIRNVIVYADLLHRWNRKINLTSISSAQECISRHFGESFLASRKVRLRGRLLDVGSGAGFPGLALKLISSQLDVVLLEPVAKKRAFLKEVARACRLGPIQVIGKRLDEFAQSEEGGGFDIITARAVGGLASLVATSMELLRRGGHLCLWLGLRQVQGILEANPEIRWLEPETIPFSRDRVILVGVQVK